MSRDSAIALAIALLVGIAAYAAHSPSLAYPFLAYGDDALLLQNPTVRSGFSWQDAARAFSEAWRGNWVPLTWISHMVDFSAYGSDAGGHHRTNLLLHALAATLLFGALRRATSRTIPPAAVALLLALHPLHVESVAWLSERKGLLASALTFASLWTYVAHAETGSRLARRTSVVCFALALLAKPTVLVFPLLLLIVDTWPLDRAGLGAARLLREKLPYLLLAGASAALTLWALAGSPVVPDLANLPLGQRLGNAVVCTLLYLGKLLLPTDLAVYYPHPNLPGGSPRSLLEVAGAAAVLAGLGLAAWRAPHPAPRAGLAWFVVALLPTLGLLQVGTQAMADRYAYVPAVGVYVGVVFLLADAVPRRPAAFRAAAAGLLCTLLALLTLATRGQVGVWNTAERLFRHATAVTEGNFTMHFLLANTLKGRGRIDEAIDQYQQALAIHPTLGEAHFNLANALQAEGRTVEAIEHYRQASLSMPGFSGARDALGRLLLHSGDLPAALAHFRAETELRPNGVDAWANLAHLLRLSGDLPAAQAAYERAASLAPDDPRWPEAIAEVRAERAAGSGGTSESARSPSR